MKEDERSKRVNFGQEASQSTDREADSPTLTERDVEKYLLYTHTHMTRIGGRHYRSQSSPRIKRRMDRRVSKSWHSHPRNPDAATGYTPKKGKKERQEKGNNVEHRRARVSNIRFSRARAILFFFFFHKIRLPSAILLLRQFRLLSIHLAAVVSFIRFRKFSCCLVLTPAGAIAPLQRRIARQLARSVGPFVNCRGGEVGNSRVHVVDGWGLPRTYRV